MDIKDLEKRCWQLECKSPMVFGFNIVLDSACKALFMYPLQFMQVEDFLDQSQNFARCVGMGQMRKICECLRATVSDLSKFFMGKTAAPKLKALLFEPLNQVKPVTDPIQKTVKRKRVNPNNTSTN